MAERKKALRIKMKYNPTYAYNIQKQNRNRNKKYVKLATREQSEE